MSPRSRFAIPEDAPLHPVLENPHEFDLEALKYQVVPGSGEPYIDLTLTKSDVSVTLRFLSPRDLQIEPGFPTPTRGMAFYDLRGYQLGDIGVAVKDTEASWGAITFWARSVEVVQSDGPT